MSENESISTEDMKLLYVTDSVDELIAHIKKHAIKKFGLIKKPYKANGGLEKKEKNSSYLFHPFM